MTLGGKVTAGRLEVTAGDDLTVTTAVGTLRATMNGAGDLTVFQTGDLIIESVAMSGGDVAIVGSGTITVQSLTGTVGKLGITSTGGSIVLASTANAGAVTLSAAGTILGTLEADSLSVTASGAITLTEADGMTVTGVVQNQAGAGVSLRTTTGSLTVGGAITVSGAGGIDLQAGGSGALSLSRALTAGSGGVTLNAGGTLMLGAEADITTANGAVSLTAGGALTMTGETVVEAGSGAITLDAGGVITLGKLNTTGTNDVVITSGGAVLDGGDSPADVAAPNARLVISAVGGIGSSANALETQVAALDLTNSGGGAIAIDEADGVVIARIAQGAAGTVSVSTASGAIRVAEAGVTTTAGAVTLYAGGSNHDGLRLDAAVRTAGGGVTLTAEAGHVTFAAGVEVVGNGAIAVTASQGAIVNDADAVGWLTDGTDFHAGIDWALKRGKFSIDVATGTVTVSVTDDSGPLANGTVLRQAEGPYIQTTEGALTLTARDGLGEAVSGFTFSPLSLLVDANEITLNSADRQTVHVLAADQVTVTGTSGAKGGATSVSTLSGSQKITSAVDAGGEDLSIVADTIDIEAFVRSAGATLTVRPVTDTRKIVLGTVGSGSDDAFYLNSDELAKLQNGFKEIVVGSAEGSHRIEVGDSDITKRGSADNRVTFSDTLVLMNQAEGGEIFIYADVEGTNSASLKIYGSGHTTTLAANVTVGGDLDAADSTEVQGTRSVTAGGFIRFGTDSSHALDGDSVEGDDTLTLTAGVGQNLSFAGLIGATDPLEGLTITQGGDVTFSRDVVVNGNLSITATGAIVFGGALTLTNGGILTINGATSVMFAATVTVAGDILIEADEIDFNGGTSTVATTGAITLKPTTVNQAIHIASPPDETDDTNTLNLTPTDLAALRGGRVLGHRHRAAERGPRRNGHRHRAHRRGCGHRAVHESNLCLREPDRGAGLSRGQSDSQDRHPSDPGCGPGHHDLQHHGNRHRWHGEPDALFRERHGATTRRSCQR